MWSLRYTQASCCWDTGSAHCRPHIVLVSLERFEETGNGGGGGGMQSVLLVEGNTQQCSHIAAAGQRTRAAWVNPVRVAASLLPAQPDSSQPCSPLGSHCGAQQAQSRTQNCSAQCMLQLNFDRRGHSFDVHQQLLAGDSKELLFASEKQSKTFPSSDSLGASRVGSASNPHPSLFPHPLLSLILLLSYFEPWWFRVCGGP